MTLSTRMSRSLAAAVALMALLVTQSPARAEPLTPMAGGGCNPGSSSGWKISACISDDGVKVYADIYIDAMGPYSSCYVQWRIRDGSTTLYVKDSGHLACHTGHYLNINAPRVAGHWYINIAGVYINGSSTGVVSAVSPASY